MRLVAIAFAAVFSCTNAYGFQQGETLLVTNEVRDVEVVAGASQPLKFEFPIPKLMVQVPEVLDASAVSANEILITGLKPGISKLTVVDENGNHFTVTVAVKIDVRILQRAIDKIFPTSQVHVDALSSKVILSGYVADSEQVTNIMELANDYFPVGVINNVRVAKSPNVAIQVKIYEVSRSKLRRLGVDWAYFGPDFQAVSSFADLIQNVGAGSATATGQQFSAAVVQDGRSLGVFIEALEQHNIAKLLDEPTLVAKDGRPAEFLSGGEFPFEVAAGLGNNTIQFRPFGTKLDIVPIVLGRNRLTLEVRAEVSEVDNTIGGNTGVPGFRVRRVNTAVDMPVGHTLALAGDYREEIETEKRGAPKLMDHPFWGAAFRKTEEVRSETELVFLLTPRFIDAVEASQLKRAPFGKSSKSPSDKELYIDGHVEVPTCPGDGCPTADGFRNQLAPANVHGNAFPAAESIRPYYQDQLPGNAIQEVVPPVGRAKAKAPVSRQASGFSWPSKR
jgi:pilus assembly protein CpaC